MKKIFMALMLCLVSVAVFTGCNKKLDMGEDIARKTFEEYEMERRNALDSIERVHKKEAEKLNKEIDEKFERDKRLQLASDSIHQLKNIKY